MREPPDQEALAQAGVQDHGPHDRHPLLKHREFGQDVGAQVGVGGQAGAPLEKQLCEVLQAQGPQGDVPVPAKVLQKQWTTCSALVRHNCAANDMMRDCMQAGIFDVMPTQACRFESE